MLHRKKAQKLNKLFRRSSLRKILLMAFLAGTSAAQAADARFTELGNSLICMCGCNQLLGGCTMINCPSSGPMRKELQGYIDQDMDDKQILATFVTRYGPKVLSSPPTTDWFNLSAWIMPFAALFVGGGLVVYFLRTWKAATPENPPPPVDTAKYQAEIEDELRKLTPED